MLIWMFNLKLLIPVSIHIHPVFLLHNFTPCLVGRKMNGREKDEERESYVSFVIFGTKDEK